MYTSLHIYAPADSSVRVGIELIPAIMSHVHSDEVRWLSHYATVLPGGDASETEPIAEYQHLSPEDAMAELSGADCACSFLMFTPGESWWDWFTEGRKAIIPPQVEDDFLPNGFSVDLGESEFIDVFSERVVNCPQFCLTFCGDGCPSYPQRYFDLIQQVPAVAYVQQFVEERTGVPWNFAMSGSY